MEAIVTVLAALLIASPLVVLALRTTRWDPVAPPRRRRVLDERDADARRAAIDEAALAAHRPDAVPATRGHRPANVSSATGHAGTRPRGRGALPPAARPGTPRLG